MVGCAIGRVHHGSGLAQHPDLLRAVLIGLGLVTYIPALTFVVPSVVLLSDGTTPATTLGSCRPASRARAMTAAHMRTGSCIWHRRVIPRPAGGVDRRCAGRRRSSWGSLSARACARPHPRRAGAQEGSIRWRPRPVGYAPSGYRRAGARCWWRPKIRRSCARDERSGVRIVLAHGDGKGLLPRSGERKLDERIPNRA